MDLTDCINHGESNMLACLASIPIRLFTARMRDATRPAGSLCAQYGSFRTQPRLTRRLTSAGRGPAFGYGIQPDMKNRFGVRDHVVEGVGTLGGVV